MYGLVQQIPQSEKTPFYPRSPYGVAKLYAYWITVNYRRVLRPVCLQWHHVQPRIARLRGETFVTRKVTRAMARIKLGLQHKLYLGNLDSRRDWGHARDYVEMQWLMLQQQRATDYVIATGVQYSVRDFVTMAAACLDIHLEWKGSGLDEQAVDQHGNVIVAVDPRYFRPAEVETLLGDASKAKKELGWSPRTDFRSLVEEMAIEDLRAAERDALVTPTTVTQPITSTSHDAKRQPHLRCRPPRPGGLGHLPPAQAPGIRTVTVTNPRGARPTDATAVQRFFAAERPAYVFLAAAKVGGILANDLYPADFIRENLIIQTNVINACYQSGVDPPVVSRLELHLSQALPPAHQGGVSPYRAAGADQPSLRLGKDLPALRCAIPTTGNTKQNIWRQCPLICMAPATTLTRRNRTCCPALIRKVSEARAQGKKEIVVWGTGTPRRELLFSEDLADGCVFLMNLDDTLYGSLIEGVPLINIGTGKDVTIRELAEHVCTALDFKGDLVFDTDQAGWHSAKAFGCKPHAPAWLAAEDHPGGRHSADLPGRAAAA